MASSYPLHEALFSAIRENDVQTVQRLLKCTSPNSSYGRTRCIEVAVQSDSYESLLLILQHPDWNHIEFFALIIACRGCSTQIIKLLLDSSCIEDVVNSCNEEGDTLLHEASDIGRIDVMQLLLDYGAMLNVQNNNGDTPLHMIPYKEYDDRTRYKDDSDPVPAAILLHAGAFPEIENNSLYTPFLKACSESCYDTLCNLLPFVTADVNKRAQNGDTALHLAVRSRRRSNEKRCDVIRLLLENGANVYLENDFGDTALTEAIKMLSPHILELILNATDKDKIFTDIIPYTFHIYSNNNKYGIYGMSLFGDPLPEILNVLFHQDLGLEFFDFVEPFHCETYLDLDSVPLTYSVITPLNTYLERCQVVYAESPEMFREFFYIFLMNGAPVDALDINECPPLVYMHYCMHNTFANYAKSEPDEYEEVKKFADREQFRSCFKEVFAILREHDCNVDYCSDLQCVDKDRCIPDAFIASAFADPTTMLTMLPYSLHSEPEHLLQIIEKYYHCEEDVDQNCKLKAQNGLLSVIDSNYQLEGITVESLSSFVPSLKHLSRRRVRSQLRNRPGGVTTTRQYLDSIEQLRAPPSIRNYLRYQA